MKTRTDNHKIGDRVRNIYNDEDDNDTGIIRGFEQDGRYMVLSGIEYGHPAGSDSYQYDEHGNEIKENIYDGGSHYYYVDVEDYIKK